MINRIDCFAKLLGGQQCSSMIQQPRDSTPFEYGDRFIPRRYSSNSDHHAISVNREMKNVLADPENSTWKKFNYAIALEQVFNITRKKNTSQWSQNRILSFCDELAKYFRTNIEKFYWAPEFNYTLTPHWYYALDWPCVPRNKPLGFMQTIHTLPGFDRSGRKKLIVWSNANKIVAFVKPEIISWTPSSPVLMVYSLDYVTALSYDPSGKLMAAGGKLRKMIVLELWETKNKNIDLKSITQLKDTSDLVCLAWNGSGSHIVCGQKSGSVTIYDASNIQSSVMVLPRQHDHAITDIKFSADFKMFSIADTAGVVSVWRWVYKNLLFKLKSPIETAIMLDWHPWCSTEFILAAHNPASIGIVNTAEKAVVGWYKQCDRKCIIDAISFNKRSGELVVAYRRMVNNELKSQLVVLATLEHVSDILRKNNIERIFHLMWSPDGTILATTGAGNTLTLWNFFGKSNQVLSKFTVEKEKAEKRRRQFDFGNLPLVTLR
ncbi:hypothetical protein DMENIID0001_046550 [Sergentomyia squamirostris]